MSIANHTIRLRLDGVKQLSRAVRDIHNARPEGQKGGKFLTGEKFITAMQESGLLPRGTVYCRITAEVGEAITLDYESFAEDDILAVPAGLEVADEQDAGTA